MSPYNNPEKWVLFGGFKVWAGIFQTKENFGSTLEWEFKTRGS